MVAAGGSAVARIAECGCDSVDGTDLRDLLSPWQRRGFPLGTWTGADDLPTGCRYLDIGDDSRVLVACSLTGADLLRGSDDVKEVCREKYAPNVVVHVPIDPDALTCDAEFRHPDYGHDCEMEPWVVPAPSVVTSTPL